MRQDRFGGKVLIERRESGRPVGLLSTTGISKNCAPRKKAAATSYLLCNCIVRDLYFSNATSSFSYLSLSLSTSSHDLFSPRFPRENGKLVRVWAGKKQERIFPSIPGALFHRVFVSYFEEFRAKDGDGSLFWRQPRNKWTTREEDREDIQVAQQVGLEIPLPYFSFPSSLAKTRVTRYARSAEHSETRCSRRSNYFLRCDLEKFKKNLISSKCFRKNSTPRFETFRDKNLFKMTNTRQFNDGRSLTNRWFIFQTSRTRNI